MIVLPTSSMAQDATRGLLHSDGGTWLNASPAPAIAAIFPDSLVQTQTGHHSRIDIPGSSIGVEPETEVQFQGDVLVLTHGGLQVATTTKIEVLVGCVSVIPVASDRTQYDVTDVDGKVRIVVSKNEIKIHSHGSALLNSKQAASLDTVLHEGEQATREDQCSPARPEQGETAKGPLLDSLWAKGVGVAIVGTLACLGLCRGGDPISPDKP